MNFNVVFIKSKNGFTKKQKGKIKKIINNTARQAVEVLKLDKNITINFTLHPFYGKFTWGLTYSTDWIHLNVAKKFTENDLRGAIFHEMHHMTRGYIILTKRKFSLLETLFSEGLAVVFEIEKNPKRIPIYAKYTNNFIKKWFPEVKKNLWNTNFSHDEWFFGKKGKPYQLDYKIGIYLVNQIKKNHPELTADKLTKKNAKELLKLSKIIL